MTLETMANNRPLACIVLAAGKGTRMRSDLPKVLHPLAGRPMLNWVLGTAEALQPERIVVVTAPDGEAVRQAALPHISVVQAEQRGTADAVMAALPALDGFDGTVIVLYGDGPLYHESTLRALCDAAGDGLAYLGMEPDDPAGYGRMVRGEGNELVAIVEEKDATPQQRAIRLCWSGVMCGPKAGLTRWLDRVRPDNAAGEYYLTDLPPIAARDGQRTVIAMSPREETLGANTRGELAVLEAKLQQRLREAAMANGATLIDPNSVFFSFDTQLGRDVTIEPHVFFGPGVVIGDGVHIKGFCRLEGVRVGERCEIGPFAQLHPKTWIGDDCIIGNFVEIKRSTVGSDVNAKHLAYIADAEIGDRANISCGAITVNYDGFGKKSRTVIGDDAMVGANVNLVAPVTIGGGAFVAAGATVTEDVPGDALAVGRVEVAIVHGWAARKRERKHV